MVSIITYLLLNSIKNCYNKAKYTPRLARGERLGMKKIAVLVSGGVDSSVSLALLKSQGYDVTAFYLKIWLEDELSYLGDCPWQEDLNYVEAVCKKLDVPLKVVSLQKEYWDRVVTYTINEIKSGHTPNPDILCNSRVKFGAFLDAIDGSYDKVATGHYAQVQQEGDKFQLFTSPDEIKDQTYFLSHLNQKQLSRAMFPIGHLQKSEVRLLAEKFDLPNKNRKDSQGICFLGKLKFSDFVKHHLGTKPGDLIELETGNKVGTHNGFWFYTIGQRQGVGLSGGPWYVAKKDPEKNLVYISKNYYSEDKVRNQFFATNLNWVGVSPFALSLSKGTNGNTNLQVKLRHGAKMYECSIEQLANGNLSVKLKSNDQGIAAGQFAVFYKAGRCLGGGTIKSRN